MAKETRPKPPRKIPPQRGPARNAETLLKLESVVAARRIIEARHQAGGSQDVTQADVDVAADTLVRERIRPYPNLLLPITGGSLSTVTPLFEDWFQRFLLRSQDPSSADLKLPMRVALYVQLLVGQFADTVRNQLQHIETPESIFEAAAALGERQALRRQVVALESERDQLREIVRNLTANAYQTNTAIEEHLNHQAAQMVEMRTLAAQIQRTALTLRQRLAEATPVAEVLTALNQGLKQLRTGIKSRRAHRDVRTARRRAVRRAAHKTNSRSSKQTARRKAKGRR